MPDELIGITMPRLSATLSPLRWPRACQRCAATEGLTFWQEHDDQDRRELVFVILCQRCADRLIESHPRLYRELGRNEPAPGVMVICEACRHRVGVCQSPRAAANGGPGLHFPAADSSVHLQMAGPGGRGRRGRWLEKWNAEPTTCEGFEADDE